MTERIQQTLRDSAVARWTALGILSFTMFAGYMFTEIISPLQGKLGEAYGWTGSEFGTVVSAYGWFNVFLGMLVIVGILLDKMGIRFSTIASAAVMVLGAAIKYYGFVTEFEVGQTILGLDIRVFYTSFGYALFGVGVEYAGITVSKSLAKWFKGKEMALAMGMQVAIARLGSFAPLAFGAKIADMFDVPTPVLMGLLFLIIGFISFLVYNVLDKRLENQINENTTKEPADEFKISDLSVIISNRGFWYLAILCVLFYSAVFPFYKYGPNLMVSKFGVPDNWAGLIPSLVPFGTIFLTPLFGGIYDKKGRGASIMILGALMLVVVHIIYYLPFLTSIPLAIGNAILLGIAFSLVPSAMWPSVTKIIPEKQLGSAYALIFWVQNWGLMGIPFVIGKILDATNPQTVTLLKQYNEQFKSEGLSTQEVANKIEELKIAGTIPQFDYSTTWLVFIGLTLLAVFVAFLLKREDRIKGYGLERPNIKN